MSCESLLRYRCVSLASKRVHCMVTFGKAHSVRPVSCTFSAWLFVTFLLPFRAMSSVTSSSVAAPVASPKGKSKSRHVSPAMLQLRAQKEANIKALKDLRKDMRKDPHHFLFLWCALMHSRVISFCINTPHFSLVLFLLRMCSRDIWMHTNRFQEFDRSSENINVWSNAAASWIGRISRILPK